MKSSVIRDTVKNDLLLLICIHISFDNPFIFKPFHVYRPVYSWSDQSCLSQFNQTKLRSTKILVQNH